MAAFLTNSLILFALMALMTTSLASTDTFDEVFRAWLLEHPEPYIFHGKVFRAQFYLKNKVFNSPCIEDANKEAESIEQDWRAKFDDYETDMDTIAPHLVYFCMAKLTMKMRQCIRDKSSQHKYEAARFVVYRSNAALSEAMSKNLETISELSKESPSMNETCQTIVNIGLDIDEINQENKLNSGYTNIEAIANEYVYKTQSEAIMQLKNCKIKKGSQEL